MQNKVPLYPYSAKDAMKRGEIEKWRESFRENCACAGGIDILIRENFDGMHLKDGTVEKIVELYGYKRVEHVLANTVQERRGDGRFRPDNRDWANSHYIPPDEMHNYCFAARSHSAILDGFISHYRKLVMDLGMFGQKQCEPEPEKLDYTGKVLVLSPNTLKEEYWSPENQLWLAQSGFGCSPTARGRSILCTCLGDGEQTRWNRNDFIGVLKDGVKCNSALGWSSTFMKEGMALFLLYLYDSENLLPGVYRMLEKIKTACGFSAVKYKEGTLLEGSQDDSALFHSIFREWQKTTSLTEPDRIRILSHLEKMMEKRVAGIMEASRRNYYGECAAYIAAIGEVKELYGEKGGKQIYMSHFANLYPRRTAFKTELKSYGWIKR